MVVRGNEGDSVWLLGESHRECLYDRMEITESDSGWLLGAVEVTRGGC